MAKKVSDLQVAMTLKRKEFVTRETAIYYETYGQIQASVEKIATQYGISLVLRYDSSPMEEDNRPSVQKGVANPVVYQRNLDLTAMVIESIKRQSVYDDRRNAIVTSPMIWQQKVTYQQLITL